MNFDKLNSYFGEGTVLKGNLKFKGLLRFDGEFDGNIISEDTFIVGDSGKVRANIRTGQLYNFGEITGDIEAVNKISLHANSVLKGNIKSPVLATEELSIFQGSCVMPPRKAQTMEEGKSEGMKKPPAATRPDMTGYPGDKPEGGAARRVAMLAVLLAMAAVWVGTQSDLLDGFAIPGINGSARSVAVDSRDEAVAAEALREEARRAFASGDFETAMLKITEAMAERGENAEDLSLLGVAAAEVGETERAIEAYKKLKLINPDLKNLEALSSLYEKADRKDELIATLKAMSDLDPANTMLAGRLERLASDRKAASDEIEQLQADMKKNPKDPELRERLARQHLERKNAAEAVNTLEAALADFPKSESLRLLMAQILQRNGKEKDAFEHYLAYGKTNPKNAVSKINAAYQSLNRGALDEAVTVFSKLLEENPDNLRARLGLATVYSKMEENEKAAEECQKILDQDADYAPAQNRLAWIYAKQGENLAKAESLSKRSLSTFPDTPEYIDTLSEINFKNGNYDEAIRLIERAVELVPGDPYYKRQLFKFRRAKKMAG